MMQTMLSKSESSWVNSDLLIAHQCAAAILAGVINESEPRFAMIPASCKEENGMTVRGNKRRMAARLAACVGALLVAMSLAACKKPPNFTGKWAFTGKTLQNGEQQKGILDLKQDGAQVTGTNQDLGGKFAVKGTANGAHLELWGA